MKTIKFVEVEDLKKELLGLGYCAFQIDSLMREAVNTTQLEKLAPDELVYLATVLGQHLNFARKCIVNLEK